MIDIKARPEFFKLATRIALLKAIPDDGTNADALKFLGNQGLIVETFQQAIPEAEAIIDAVITTPNNPYGDDREAIAAEIMRRLEAQDVATFGRPSIDYRSES